jgi:hypothetical protein
MRIACPNCRCHLEGDSDNLLREIECPVCKVPFFADTTAPLRASAAKASSSIYLQLISVIQSMALGLWVYSLDLSRLDDFTYLFQNLIILQLLVITWHEYVLGTVTYEWPIGLFDAWLPISFGISQFYLIKAKTFQDFCWALPAFTIVAALAFLNQYLKSRAYEGNAGIIAMLEKHRRRTFFQTGAFALVFLSAAWLSPLYGHLQPVRELVLFGLNGSLLFHQIRLWLSTRKLFHRGNVG